MSQPRTRHPRPGVGPQGEGPRRGFDSQGVIGEPSETALGLHSTRPDWLAPTSRWRWPIENCLGLWPAQEDCLGKALHPDSAPTSTPPAQALCPLRLKPPRPSGTCAAAPGRKQSQVRRAGPSTHTRASEPEACPCITPGRSPAPSGLLLQRRGLQGLPRLLTPERMLTTTGPGGAPAGTRL